MPEPCKAERMLCRLLVLCVRLLVLALLATFRSIRARPLWASPVQMSSASATRGFPGLQVLEVPEVATCDSSDPAGSVGWRRLPMGPFSSSSSLVSTICAGSGEIGRVSRCYRLGPASSKPETRLGYRLRLRRLVQDAFTRLQNALSLNSIRPCHTVIPSHQSPRATDVISRSRASSCPPWLSAMLPCPEPTPRQRCSACSACSARLGRLQVYPLKLFLTPLCLLWEREKRKDSSCTPLASSWLCLAVQFADSPLGPRGHRLVPRGTGSFGGQISWEAFGVWGSAGAALPGSAQ